MGLDVGTSTAEGLDVAGTINGAVALGSGQFLTGAIGNDSDGLKVQITGGALGARGTVNYSQGYAYQIDRFIGVAIGLSGSISARTDGINSSVEHINAQRDALNKRLDAIQARYYAQFNAMDTLIAQMRSTSDFLTQQLANISNLTAQSGK